MRNEKIYTVAEFVGAINASLEHLKYSWVEGEVSELKKIRDKWATFKLKDGEAVLDCFVWMDKVPETLEDGTVVQILGYPDVKAAWGKLSFRVMRIELFGEGALRREYEKLKAELAAKGIFASERKRPLPLFPKTVGLITSKEGMAVHDFIRELNDRFSGVTVFHLDVHVQGRQALPEIVQAINYFNKEKPGLDALVIIRGGGSFEDLHAFNTREVAMAVFGSKIVTVAAIGHEKDVSLTELAADFHASTPTDAANNLFPDKRELLARSEHFLLRTASLFEAELRRKTEFLGRASSVALSFLHTVNGRVGAVLKRLLKDVQIMEVRQKQRRREVGERIRALHGAEGRWLPALGERAEQFQKTIAALDPKRLLSRGYSIVRKGNKAVRSVKELAVGDSLSLLLSDGEAASTVTEIT